MICIHIIFHHNMLLIFLILNSLLPHKFKIRFAHGLTSGSHLLFQFALYIYHHAVISGFYLFLLSWYNLDSILKVINFSQSPFINQMRCYQRLYGLLRRSPNNQCHQLNSPLFRYPTSWVILYAVMDFYNYLNPPGFFVLNYLLTTYHCNLSLDKLLDL